MQKKICLTVSAVICTTQRTLILLRKLFKYDHWKSYTLYIHVFIISSRQFQKLRILIFQNYFILYQEMNSWIVFHVIIGVCHIETPRNERIKRFLWVLPWRCRSSQISRIFMVFKELCANSFFIFANSFSRFNNSIASILWIYWFSFDRKFIRVAETYFEGKNEFLNYSGWFRSCWRT